MGEATAVSGAASDVRVGEGKGVSVGSRVSVGVGGRGVSAGSGVSVGVGGWGVSVGGMAVAVGDGGTVGGGLMGDWKER